MNTQVKRKVLQNLLSLAKSMKIDEAKSKFAPKQELEPEPEPDEGQDPEVEIEIDPMGDDVQSDELKGVHGDGHMGVKGDGGKAQRHMEVLRQLKADPEALKKLLGK